MKQIKLSKNCKATLLNLANMQFMHNACRKLKAIFLALVYNTVEIDFCCVYAELSMRSWIVWVMSQTISGQLTRKKSWVINLLTYRIIALNSGPLHFLFLSLSISLSLKHIICLRVKEREKVHLSYA